MTPVDCSPPGSAVPGILQARILEWVPISPSRGSSRPRDQTHVSCIAERFFTVCHQETNAEVSVKQPLGNSQIKLSDPSSLICLSLSLSLFFSYHSHYGRMPFIKKKKRKTLVLDSMTYL